MEQPQFTTMANKCHSVLDANVLNERGKQLGFAKRARLITPFHLGLSVVASMAAQQLPTIADLHRQFNALWEIDSDCKAFYKQLLKSTSPEFFRPSLSHIMSQLSMKVLGFEAGKAFSTAMSANISADLVRSDQERRQSAIEELKALLDQAEADVADIYGYGSLILRVLPQRMDPARHL